MWLSVCEPRNFVFTVSPNLLFFIPTCNAECDEFFVMNFITFVLFKFRTKLLAAIRLIIRERERERERAKFDTEQKSSKFVL